jgi:hypothetical protein
MMQRRRPNSLSWTQRPSAVTHSPALTEVREPTTATKSRCPLAFTLSTAQPFSSLKKVTRSIRPERLSGGRDGGSGRNGRRLWFAGPTLARACNSSYVAAMPENELSVIKLSRGLRSNLTAREKHDLVKAERTIAKGLKSFLAVGMALKEIRDKRLYRQQYDTFEEYCIRRWDFSRIHAYPPARNLFQPSDSAKSFNTALR